MSRKDRVSSKNEHFTEYSMNIMNHQLWILKALEKKYEDSHLLNSFRHKITITVRDYFLELCDLFIVNNLYEVGAHKAETSILFLSRNRHAEKAVAYEANPYTFSYLLKKARAKGVETFNLGVCNSRDTLDLYIPKWSSDLMPGNSSFLKRLDEVAYAEVRVEVEKLDHLVISEPIEFKSSLWIDVEGLTLQVLKGAEALFTKKQFAIIHLELETVEFWNGQSPVGDISDFLMSRDYLPIIRDNEYGNQFNVIYIHADLFPIAMVLVDKYTSSLHLMKLTKLDRLKLYSQNLATRRWRTLKNSIANVFGKDNIIMHFIFSVMGSKSSNLYLRKYKKVK